MGDGDNMTMTSFHARACFVKTIQSIFTSVVGSEMKSDALTPNYGEHFEKDSEELTKYVNTQILGGRPPHRRKVKCKQTYELLLSANDALDVDDYVSALSCEAYVDCRLKPNLAEMEDKAPRLKNKTSFHDVTLVILATLGTLLAALGFREWVPVTVALGTAISASSTYLALQARLEVTNEGVAMLQNVMTYWEGLTIFDRRMPQVFEYVVGTLERVLQAEAIAGHSASILMPAQHTTSPEDVDNKAKE